MRLYDTATRAVREFTPLVDGKVSMYVCGATVQSAPHVGHIRSGVAFDVLARWLRTSGYEVTLVRNVTDIDDKILAKESVENRPWWAVAAHYEREFQNAYEILGCTPPTVEPRATGHITQMIELMQTLIERGHAYAADGDVYFDVRSFADYGKLSGQKIDDLLPAGDSEGELRKKDSRDFALWKSVKPGEPSWPTPWGNGRPGWHIECSAMAQAYLGDAFDIHGGGLDLVFPHHENEVAQSKAAGQDFANFWLHNAWVTTAGEKMSKSLGNSLVVTEVAKRVRPIELRWYLASAHYRSNLEFSDSALQESAVAFQRIENFVERAAAVVGDVELTSSAINSDFATAMNEDLNVPAALAVLHEVVGEGNTLLAKKADAAALIGCLTSVRQMLDVLGVDPLSPTWADDSKNAQQLESALDYFVQQSIAVRNAAKENKNFDAADAIRDSLRNAGIALEDTSDGVRWNLEK
ncbi:MAG: cysteine--tRNA ligase [Actinobacteria bacterium]|uniref:Cysteine--tRNA ligase n=2 Tax=freshwater metagenome TaxID=449393 RepID=A0A6J6KAQ0_9ZZZZ|nr:cysteine--tRNA ligase [Actinomycetota bacterium]